MKTLNIMLSNLSGRVIPIGYEGENLYTRIRINCIEVFSEYPDATVSMVVSPPVGDMYPAVVEKSGVMVIWDITDSVLSSNGSGECQLTFTEGDVVRKSVVFGISINRSLIASGEAPEPVQEWIDRAEQTAQEIAENAAMLAKQDIVESYGEIAPAIIETASGEIASISDGADGMLVKTLTVDIDPVQDLHGYDNPWPAGGGKNLFPLPTAAETKNGVTVEATSSGELWVHGTPTIESGYLIFTMPSVSQSIIGQTATISINEKIAGIGISGGASGGGLNIAMSDTVTSRTALYSSVSNDPTINVRYDVGTIDKKFKIQLEIGSSVTAWVPYENSCPISGWESANVWGAGKNLFGYNFESPKTSGGVEYTLNADGSITCVGTTTGTSWGPGNTETILLKAGTYKINLAGATNIRAVMVNASSVPEKPITTDGGAFTLEKDTLVYAYIRSLTGDSGVVINETIYMQLEIGSTTTEYEKHHGSKTEYDFPQEAGEVPGGKLTIWQDGTGTLVVKKADLDLGTVPWMRHQNKSVFRTYDQISDMSPSTGGTIVQDFICDNYKTETWSHVLDTPGYDCCICEGWTGASYIAINDSRYNDYTAEQFQTAMSGVHIVYNLATPVVYNLTSQDVIALLKGNNNLWADCGNISIEYPADTKLYIDGKVAELQALILENISNS